jgi:hypothetical protein
MCWGVEKLSGGCGAKAIWYATAKNCSVENTWRDTFHEISEEILRRFGSGEPHSLASIIKSFGGYWAGEKIDISGVLDMMFQTDLDGRITREKVGKVWMYTISRPAKEAEEPAPQPTQPGDKTWDQFVATYRATETPLPEIHPKLIAGMVAWADENGHDVEQIIGAPKEAVEIWVATAKNFRGQTCAGNLQRETTAKIFQRFGDERRHSIAAMASSLNLKEKFLAGVLDMMFRADWKNTISREPDSKSWKYTIRRPAKATS